MDGSWGSRFTRQLAGCLVGNLRYLLEKQLIELPIEADEVRRCFLNVAPGEQGDGYEHATRGLKDVFDAFGLASSESSVEKREVCVFWLRGNLVWPSEGPHLFLGRARRNSWPP